MPETTPLIKAALNLRVGAGFDVYVRCILYISIPELHRYGKCQPAEFLRAGVMYNKNVPHKFFTYQQNDSF